MDDEVVEVHAFGSSAAHPELATVGDVDSAVVNLRFASGTTGTVEMARNTSYGEDVRTEVLATAGSVWVGHLPVSHGAWSGGDAAGAVAADPADPAIPRFEAAYAAQTRGFARSIIEDRAVEVPGIGRRSGAGDRAGGGPIECAKGGRSRSDRLVAGTNRR